MSVCGFACASYARPTKNLHPRATYMNLKHFAEKWTHPEYPPDPVTEDELRAVEDHFDVRLPADYRQSVLETGLPRPTIALLDAIVESGQDLADASEFLTPDEIVDLTEESRAAGLPHQFIVFASDSGGNLFCFDADRLKSNAPDAPSVWLFDHDSGAAKCSAPNFDSWIATFCEVEPWPGTELD